MKLSLLSIMVLLVISSAVAQGHLILSEKADLQTERKIELRHTDARISIRNGVASVTITQTFYNPTRQRLEGEYVFLLPGEAQVYNFSLYINGQKTAGQLLDGKEAFDIYADIVRRLKDPALLEYAGSSLFKARIFPIEPGSESKVELSYVNVLDYTSKNFRFRFPVHQIGSDRQGDLRLSISIQEDSPIENVYSPSHEIKVQRERSGSARIDLEVDRGTAPKDFLLFYTLADADISCSLFSFRPRTDRDGYFMLLISPTLLPKTVKVIPRDIIFVTDISGSMQGSKIEQARAALRFCVDALDRHHRFSIISFSSGLQFFARELQSASPEVKQNAYYFIDNLTASGGTNINQALREALLLKAGNDERQTDIIFLTDGLPTEGETEIQRIIQNIQGLQRTFIRIFCFGVGYDVNTFLLDKISRDTRGSADYIKPGDNLESVISTFFAKVSSPVLTGLSLDYGTVPVYDVYPVQLPDIFKGDRLLVMGRYRQSGDTRLQLSGQEGIESRKFTYPVIFQNRETENDFIAKLWANRKVQYLLSEIRFKGENSEWVESIKALGKEYGIVTPYTSYLVVEQQQEMVALEEQVRRGAAGISQQRISGEQDARQKQAALDNEAVGSADFYQSLLALPAAPQESQGRTAVISSRTMKKIDRSEQAIDMLLTVMRVADRTFNLRNGMWWEEGIAAGAGIDREIRFLSADYFQFLQKNQNMRKILALGENVVFRLDGRVIRIQSAGTGVK